MATVETDKGWSWVIAAACCWVTFVIQGLVRSSGVVYVALIDSYRVNRAQASWPFTLRIAIWNLSGPITGALSYRWSIRAITIAGVLLVTVTNVICWFASDIYVITFFLGGLQGLGVGMAVTLVPVIINQYFVKYKSTGAGIACAGATAGSFALPPIVEFAIEEYGLKGAFLMMAGITLHGVLGAALMRPAEWLVKKIPRRKSRTSQEKSSVIQNKCGDQNLNFLKSRSAEKLELEETKSLLNDKQNEETKVTKPLKSVRFSCDDKAMENYADTEESCLVMNPTYVTVIADTNTNHQRAPELNNDVENIDKKMLDDDSRSLTTEAAYVHVIEPLPTKYSSDLKTNTEECLGNDIQTSRYGKLQFVGCEEESEPKVKQKPSYNMNGSATGDYQANSQVSVPSSAPYSIITCTHGPPPRTRKWLQGIMEPIKAASQIVKNPIFLIIACNYSIFFLSYMTYLIVIVDYSLDLGESRTDSVFLVSTFSIADLCGRLGSGWITDSGILKRKHLMMGNMITVGGLFIATSFATTYMSLTAVSVCTGLIVGINLIIFYALLEEYLGLKELPMAVGLMNFSIGIISLVTPILTGYFRDTMGSYNHLFHFLGSLSVFCGLLWLLEPIYFACNKQKAKEKQLPC